MDFIGQPPEVSQPVRIGCGLEVRISAQQRVAQCSDRRAPTLAESNCCVKNKMRTKGRRARREWRRGPAKNATACVPGTSRSLVAFGGRAAADPCLTAGSF